MSGMHRGREPQTVDEAIRKIEQWLGRNNPASYSGHSPDDGKVNLYVTSIAAATQDGLIAKVRKLAGKIPVEVHEIGEVDFENESLR